MQPSRRNRLPLDASSLLSVIKGRQRAAVEMHLCMSVSSTCLLLPSMDGSLEDLGGLKLRGSQGWKEAWVRSPPASYQAFNR